MDLSMSTYKTRAPPPLCRVCGKDRRLRRGRCAECSPLVTLPIRNKGKLPGRNAKCPCASGRKWKECHGK